MLIRRAVQGDIAFLDRLLYQVAAVHGAIRPDLFRSGAKKYTDGELLLLIGDDEKPIFVAEENGIPLGYCFCAFQRHKSDGALCDFDSLYIDDLCVDEDARGRHVGTALYEYVKAFARESGCYNLTLNVWSGNDGARAFYDSMGLKATEDDAGSAAVKRTLP